MPTHPISFRVASEDIGKELLDWFKKLGKSRGESVGEALIYVVDQYKKGFKELGKDPIPNESFIAEIGCAHLKFEDWDFKCFKRFGKRLKPDLLGSDHTKVKTRCAACKQGQAESILEQYQKKLRGHNIRGILSMIQTFEQFAESGVPSTIYFCNRIKGKQVVTGKKTITCTKHDARVPIDPTCTDPLCPHFDKYTMYVEQEFPKETLKLIEGIAEDYKRIEDLTPKEPKEVEVDQE
jgi:hypothetical protein